MRGIILSRKRMREQPTRPLIQNANGDWRYADREGVDGSSPVFKPPYSPGEICYVKETWAWTINVNDNSPWPDRPHTNYDPGPMASCIIYRADGEWTWCDGDGGETEKSYWKSSVHMPEIAARRWVRIISVKPVEVDGVWYWDKPETEEVEKP